MYSEQNSNIIFGVKTAAMFANNEVTHDGGAIHCYNKSSVIFTGIKQHKVELYYSESSSDIVFKQNSTTKFINNTGLQHGGTLFTKHS